MGKIYENCARTLVWLGPDTDGTALETTDFIKNTSWVTGALIEKYGSVTAIPALSRYQNPISQNPAKWLLYAQFVKNVWFTRVWVMQEVGIAPDVIMHLGDADIRFSDVMNVNELMRHAPHLFETLPLSRYLHDAMVGLFLWYGNKHTWRDQVVQDLLHQDAILVPQPNMVDALIQSSRRNVTDPRDYIYALLGHPLACVGRSETIVQADYTRHLDEVFADVSAKLLQYTDPTLALSVVSDMGQRQPRDLNDHNQPTWVARWDLSLETNNIGRPGQWFFAGGKDAKTSLRIDMSTKTLMTPAIVFETIKWVGVGMTAEEIALDAIAASGNTPGIERVWKSLPEKPCRYEGTQGRWDAFTLTLASGVRETNPRAEEQMDTHRRIAKAYETIVKSLKGQDQSTSADSDPSLRADAREFENDIKWTALKRPFMITEKGFYGLGPTLTQVGDVVAVLPGFNVTYVLRPAGEEGNKYKLVGASFVQGVMAGEIVDESDPLGLGAGTPKEIIIV